MEETALFIEKIAGHSSGETICRVLHKRVHLAEGAEGTLASCVYLGGKDVEIEGASRDVYEIVDSNFEGARESEGLLNLLASLGERVIEYARNRELEVGFACLFFLDNVCYVLRVGEKVKVFVFEPPKNVEIKFEKGSGHVRAGQLYVVGTSEFFSTFDTGTISNNADLGEVIDGLATDIHANENQSEIAALFVMVKREKAKLDDDSGEPAVGDSKDSAEAEVEDNAELKVGKQTVTGEVEGREETEKEDGLVRRVRALLGRIVSLVSRELKFLRRGNLGAIFRLKRGIVALAIFVILVLTFSIGFNIYQRGQKQKEVEVANHLTLASSKLSEGLGLLSLNKSKAREVFVEAEGEVKAALSINPKNERALKISAEVEAQLKETESSANVDFKTFFEGDGSMACLGGDGKKVVANLGEKAVLLSSDGKKTSQLDLKGTADNCFLFDNKLFFIRGKEVFKADISSEKIESVGKINSGFDIGVFIGNVYVLGGEGIFKFVPAEHGYGEAKNYLSKTDNFGENSRMAIDGNVWVSGGNKIIKYLRGEAQSFEISGLPVTGEFGLIYTDTSSSNLYVVDRTNSALLVIDKEGVYKKAYQSPEFAMASDILVNEAEKKMYISVGKKIIEADLGENP